MTYFKDLESGSIEVHVDDVESLINITAWYADTVDNER